MASDIEVVEHVPEANVLLGRLIELCPGLSFTDEQQAMIEKAWRQIRNELMRQGAAGIVPDQPVREKASLQRFNDIKTPESGQKE